MATVSPILEALFRWLHVIFGIIWIGHLYFFNFVNASFAATMDADTKRKVVPELMPRALWWFRWGAVWTWAFGFLLLLLVFYHGKQMFDVGSGGWGLGPIVLVSCALLWGPFVYDILAKSPLGKNARIFGILGFVLIGVMLLLMIMWGKFSYRAANIHMGALLGTIMIFNVWTHIWPAQKKIITAIKEGTPPDPALVAFAGGRSRHNTYMSVPLTWTMINAHTTAFSGGNLGLDQNTWWIGFLVVTALGWHIVWHLYKRAGKVQGF
jgi:uncharacterized membrane protein